MSTPAHVPPSWSASRLGDLGRYLNGRGFGKSEWSQSGRPIIRIQNLTGTSTKFNYYSGEVDEDNIARPGDLLMSWAATLDAFIWPGPEGCVNQHIFKVESFIDKRFHFYLLRNALDELYRKTHGSGMVHITRSKFDETPAAVPPLSEQVRIVAKIEELFSDLDAGVAALERVRANLKRYRAAVLKAAVEGHLTEEWRTQHPATEPAAKLLERILAERRAKWEQDQLRKFKEAGKTPPKGWKEKYEEPAPARPAENQDLPSQWCWASVEQLAAVGTGTTPARGVSKFYSNGTIPWVTSSAVNAPFVTEGSELVTEVALDETSLRLYPVHTLLVALYGEGQTRGKVTELLIPATINQALAALVLSDQAEACRAYLKLFLAANYIRLRSQSAGGVQPNLNLGLVRQIAVALPSLAEQAEIVAEVDRRLSVADAAEQQVEHALQRAARLRQSILKRAFEGKLVPQDPTDEPAAALLARIGNRAADASGASQQAHAPKPGAVRSRGRRSPVG